MPDGYKRCPKCEEIRPHSDWGRNRAATDGFNSHCKPCRRAEDRRRYFKRTHGLTEAELAVLFAEQCGICAICLERRAEHVDHDHETGRVRGVLCFACNAALGQLRDRPDVLRRAADYLEGIVWKPTLVAPGVYRLPS
ncbi:endonuclease VII domain-containing protein [Kitasatospora sp. NPDC093558]|uniref:endonuclease VII domain-containing protein n=1 Tax=Kitasatospora sp. NPDC093558 TaxID=3155201 RepID=UPI00342F3A4D